MNRATHFQTLIAALCAWLQSLRHALGFDPVAVIAHNGSLSTTIDVLTTPPTPGAPSVRDPLRSTKWPLQTEAQTNKSTRGHRSSTDHPRPRPRRALQRATTDLNRTYTRPATAPGKHEVVVGLVPP